MEEKLSKLIMKINECSDKSDEIYFVIEFRGDNKKIELYVRLKKDYSILEERNLYLKYADIKRIDDLIKFVEEYR